MERLGEEVAEAAGNNVTVLLSGESGTGREAIARRIHERSARASAPFLEVGCGWLGVDGLALDLFGLHEGGLLRLVRDGTLFLSDVGYIHEPLHERLAAALGPHAPRIIISARCGEFSPTGQPLETLDPRVIEVPSLRRRGADLQPITCALIRRLGGPGTNGLSAEAGAAIRGYSWPGNLPELLNCLRWALVASGGGRIDREHLPQRVAQSQSSPRGRMPDLATVERTHIQKVLHAVEGNKSRAALILGLDRKTLYRKLDRYG